jgi:prolyl-tRNA synthetase
MQRSAVVKEKAEALYHQLSDLGIEVLLDDRNERPGVLFADNDLMGIPHRLVVSDRNLEQGCVEYKSRVSGEAQQVSLDEVAEFILNVNSI